jgi:hypothetical protein
MSVMDQFSRDGAYLSLPYAFLLPYGSEILAMSKAFFMYSPDGQMLGKTDRFSYYFFFLIISQTRWVIF